MTDFFGHKEFLVKSTAVFGGVVHRFSFPNGYIASVVRRFGSYGYEMKLWELAVMYDGEIVYDTPITNDVLGWLSEEDVEKTLKEIKKLPEREK